MKKLYTLFLILIFITSLQSNEKNLSTLYSPQTHSNITNTSWKHFQNIIKNQISDDVLFQSFMHDCQYIQQKSRSLQKRHVEMLKQWSLLAQSPTKKISPPENDAQWTDKNISEKVKDLLVLEAQKARTHYYAPYSKFPVGAALLTKSGQIFHGCNVENAAYGPTICAERNAILQAYTKINRGINFEKDKHIVAIAIVLRSGGSPCGTCRQVLNEANPNTLVIMADVDGSRLRDYTIKELLPIGFGPENLR